MSNNYNILRNQKQPTSESIARHKNFDALLEAYQSSAKSYQMQAVVRRMAYISATAAAIAASVILVINFLRQPDTATMTEEAYFAQLPIVHPPIETAKPAYQRQVVNTITGGNYQTPRGARLVIPTQAFMNDRGELITGEVDLLYRELYDYVDFFLAGIPMTYDQDGTRYQLDAAGMIELYAEQNGVRVALAPGKVIEVELVSEIYLGAQEETPKYQVYKLDTNARAWILQDVQNVQIIEDIANATPNINNSNPIDALRSEYASEVATIETAAAQRLRTIEATLPTPPEPVRPVQAASNRPLIEPKFLETALIEDDPNTTENESERLRKLLEGTYWQIAPNTAYDERDFQIDWEQVRLRKLSNNNYELIATKGTRTLQLIVEPVQIGKDYQRALAQYERDYAEWQQQIAARNVQLQGQKEAVAAETQQQKEAARRRFEAKLNAAGISADQLISRKRIINRFGINSLGLWSCDRLIPPAQQPLQGTLEDQFGKEYEREIIYLVNKRYNTVYRYYVTEDNPPRFDAQSDNLLWVVTGDNQVAILRPTDFKKAAAKKRQKTVRLHRLDQPIRAEQDARAVLKWQ